MLISPTTTSACNCFLEDPVYWIQSCGIGNHAPAALPPNHNTARMDCGSVGEEDCSFLITTATVQQNGESLVFVQANDTSSPQSWTVFNGFGNVVIATGNGPVQCFTIPSNFGPIIRVEHYILDAGGAVVATCKNPFIVQAEPSCEEEVVTARVLNCSLQTSLGITIDAINTPFVIDFGDGSPAEASSSDVIEHTYNQPGTYNTCLTYIAGNGEIPYYATCCYLVEIALPSHCTCPASVVSVAEVEPCTWKATMNFDLEGHFPTTVDYGDGSAPAVVTGPTSSHDYPAPGSYQVCYSYEAEPGYVLNCCEWINIPGCCLNPYFEINAISPGVSCVNPLYRISDAECQSSILEATHIWVFSDSTVYMGTNPPDHLFTNFIDFTGEVCVTHTIICCEDTASYTACVSHPQGAFLGTPNQDLFFTDTLPFTGQTVRQFILQNANGPWPLVIDGTLVANETASFGAGTWNMGKDAEVLISGPANLGSRGFTLNGTIVRSAFRLNSNTDCCRWKGIHSEGRTFITLTGASLMDADYAIRYPATNGVVTGGIFPRINSTGSFFINNYFGIKSEGQHVLFSNFSGNYMDGAQEDPHVCGCIAANAFDFDNTNPQLTVNIQGAVENEVFHYEKAFNFRNSRLRVRNFEIHNLRNYDPVPLPFNNDTIDDNAIGIDFRWTKANNSSLNIDQIGFTDFEAQGARSVAVRDNISNGKHTLTASSTTQALFIGNVAAGYELIVGSNGSMNGTIQGNTINTNGGTQFGFGINGSINSADNILNVVNNTMSISTNSSSDLNGGVVLASPAEMDQDYKILDNSIGLSLNNNGVGIGITNARGFSVRRNKLLNAASITGINLREGGAGRVDCNDVRDKTTGINVNSSFEVEYSSNNLQWNKRDLIFTGDGNAVNGSLIRWNTFRNSDFESILYNPGVQTGPQLHNQYNKWHERNGNEAVHSSSSSAIIAACRFLFPFGALPNTVMHPSSNPAALFVPNTPGVLIDSIPADTNFCTSANDAVAAMSALDPDPAGTWASIVQDPIYWSGLTPAEQAMMRQEIYGLLLAQPNWVSSNTTLSGFKSAQDASFIGQSESLRRAWQQLMNSIATHQASQASTRADLAALSDQMEGWLAAIVADPNQEASLQPQIDAAQQQSDALAAQLEQADIQFYPTVQATVSQLLVQNAALDESTTHTWSEKRYNQIALNHLAGTTPDSAAIADLRTIAQTCLKVGGRAVMGARGQCETWLKEYYDEDNCNGLGGRSTAGAAAPDGANSLMLRILPNPADDEVRVSLNMPSDGAAVKMQFLTLSGQEVHTATMASENGDITVNVKGWPDGVYVARVILGNETFSQTFVVQHH